MSRVTMQLRLRVAWGWLWISVDGGPWKRGRPMTRAEA